MSQFEIYSPALNTSFPSKILDSMCSWSKHCYVTACVDFCMQNTVRVRLPIVLTTSPFSSHFSVHQSLWLGFFHFATLDVLNTPVQAFTDGLRSEASWLKVGILHCLLAFALSFHELSITLAGFKKRDAHTNQKLWCQRKFLPELPLAWML